MGLTHQPLPFCLWQGRGQATVAPQHRRDHPTVPMSMALKGADPYAVGHGHSLAACCSSLPLAMLAPPETPSGTGLGAAAQGRAGPQCWEPAPLPQRL